MEDIIKRLKGKNMVLTSQRLAILDIIKSKKIHLTAEEIYKILKKKFPTVSFATVYNILQKFVELGEIQRLSIQKDKSCYDWEASSHHHFYCERCKKIYNIEVECPHAKCGHFQGHKINQMQAYFYGICKGCRK